MKYYLFTTFTSSCYAEINSKKREIKWLDILVTPEHRSKGERTAGHWIPLSKAGRIAFEAEYRIKPLTQIHACVGRVTVPSDTDGVPEAPFVEMYKKVLNELPLSSPKELQRLQELMRKLSSEERIKMALELLRVKHVLEDFKKVFKIQ